MIASLQAVGFCADVKGAFTQPGKGLRKESVSCNPPPGGIPGEDDPNILIELLTEIYGLISGPPAWRRTLSTAFKELDFRRHPLAPCVVTMCDQASKGKEILIGVSSIETDDLLGGGIGPKWTAAIENLLNNLNLAVGETSMMRLKSTAALLLDNFKTLGSQSLWDAT